MITQTHSGGCQCGAVRFKVIGPPGECSICHCRMCQKASASHALALVSTRGNRVEWTRGEPGVFQSSNHARRLFCRECGTPLGYDAPDGLALAIVVFDDPESYPPTIAYGIEGKLPWADTLEHLPQYRTLDDVADAPFLATLIDYQHPDYDTADWQPAKAPADTQPHEDT